MAEDQLDLAGSTYLGRTEPAFTIVRRGFDREQVLEHLSQTGEHVADLESRLGHALRELAEAQRELGRARHEHVQARLELAEVRREFEEVRRELEEARRERDSATAAERDPYEVVSAHVMDVVRGFDRDVERVGRKARLEASTILAEARSEAAKVRIAAQNDEKAARDGAERLLGEARDEAASVRAELAPLRQWTLSQAQAIRDRMRISLLEFEGIMTNEPDGERVIVLDSVEEPDLPPVP